MIRILLVKTSSLGDLVHNLPAITDIHAHVHGARIDWLVEEGFADIPALHPGVAGVIPVALRRWRKGPWRRPVRAEIGALRARLRREEYDVVIDSQGLLKSAWLARLAGRPVYGPDWRSAREPLAAAWYRRGFPVPRGRHAVVRMRTLAAQVFGYAVPPGPPDYGIGAGLPPPPGVAWPAAYVVCLHGTSRDAKLWRQEYWVALGRALAERGLAAVLPWGSEAEQGRAQAIAAAVPGALVPPRLSIRALAGGLNAAAAVVGVDTGLVHLAAALGRPTVEILTDTSPDQTGVVGPDPALTANLGDRGAMPTVAEVLQQLEFMGVVPC